MTLSHAATKSRTNFSLASSLAYASAMARSWEPVAASVHKVLAEAAAAAAAGGAAAAAGAAAVSSG